jgi:hypothetical protein
MEILVIHILLIVFGLLSFSGPVFGSERTTKNEWPIEKVKVFLGFDTDFFVYSSLENTNACQVFGIDIIEDEPCFPVSFRYQRMGSLNADKIYNQLVSKIEAIPLRHAVVNKELKNDHVIVSRVMPMNNHQYHVKMFVAVNLLAQYDGNSLLYKFAKKPWFFPKNKGELIERELITVEGYHGSKGYENKSLLYSYPLKKPLFCLARFIYYVYSAVPQFFLFIKNYFNKKNRDQDNQDNDDFVNLSAWESL